MSHLDPRNEPAVAVGIVLAAIYAALTSLAGNDVIGQDVVDTIGRAIDPNQNGWAIPLIAGALTRFFVKPAAPREYGP